MPSEGKISPSLRDIYSSSYGHSKCLGKNKIKAHCDPNLQRRDR